MKCIGQRRRNYQMSSCHCPTMNSRRIRFLALKSDNSQLHHQIFVFYISYQVAWYSVTKAVTTNNVSSSEVICFCLTSHYYHMAILRNSRGGIQKVTSLRTRSIFCHILVCISQSSHNKLLQTEWISLQNLFFKKSGEETDIQD